MSKERPPRLAEKLLTLLLKEDLAEEVLGDLDEKFYSILDKKSVRKARLNYWYQVLNYLRPFAFKFFRFNSIFATMISHNFKIGYRILLKNKAFSAINIGGLALGMTVAILIGLWIFDEFSFNKNHENYDRIVQVMRKDSEQGVTYVNSSLVGQVGVFMKETYPTLFDHVAMTFYRTRPQLLSVGKQSFEKVGYFFQPDAPQMLRLTMKAGTQDGIRNPDGIMLSESLAKTFFNEENPIGKIISINTRVELQVTGVYEDLPINSEFGNASYLVSLDLIYNEENPYKWNNYNVRVYAQLKEGVDVEEASSVIKDIMTQHRSEEDGPMELFLLPMRDWHLNSTFEDGIRVAGKRMQFIWLYGLIGVFVLVLAFINFMNLNTARYQNRGKEVGIRKTVGSLRSQLVSQFFAESVIYALVAFLISLLAVFLILPWFNGISDKGLVVPFANPWFWAIGLAFTLISAVLAGSYPALFLSSFGPLKALSGNLKQGTGSVRLRQGLVVFQFTISMILIIGTITVYNQIEHAKNRPVGYNQEDLITVRGRSGAFYNKYDLLRTELKKTGAVIEIAEANYPLTTTLGNNNGFSLLETGERFGVSFNTIYVTPEYGTATEWELVAGRDFSRELGHEKNSMIVSESAVLEMGLQDPVGQKISSRHDRREEKVFTIIGVVKDMIKESPFEPARPLMVFASDESEPFLFIRIKPDADYIDALPKIEEAFGQVLPGHPFNFEFVDSEYMTKFRSEERIGSLAAFFSILAILISCLGLFGLSAFMAEQRTKEVGIRKVLGASTGNLWRLLSRDFTILVMVSCLFAIPLASYLLNQWLTGYDYSTEVHWWTYVVAAVSCVLITLLTVSFHSLKASVANPVDSLRSE